MRYVLIGIVFAIFIGIKGIYQINAAEPVPSGSVIQASLSAQTFVGYANALNAFLLKNPTFIGTVTGAQLAALGSSFSAEFLSKANNKISAFGTNGRSLTAYAELQPGALGEIIEMTENDASYGTSNGSTWTSVIQGATAQPLSVNAPVGSVVYLVQLGR